jgi:hypothetical protein
MLKIRKQVWAAYAGKGEGNVPINAGSENRSDEGLDEKNGTHRFY